LTFEPLHIFSCATAYSATWARVSNTPSAG